jgi:dimethylargininase
MGLQVVSLPPEPELPDAVFVEDSAIVLNELAILGATAVPSRALELASVREFLSTHREVRSLGPGARFEGGDVVRHESRLYVGHSSRTCRTAIDRLQEILSPYGYDVRPVKVSGCLHLSTGASSLGRNTVLVNPDWVDASAFEQCEVVAIPADEPWAANTLAIDGAVLMPEGFPQTRALLEQRGFKVYTTDISEFMKAEAGVTCLTNILEVSEETADFQPLQPADDGVRAF